MNDCKCHVKTAETYNSLNDVYRNECLYSACVFQWCKGFQDGRQYIESDSHLGRSSILKTDNNIENIDNLVRSDRWSNINAFVETAET